METSRAIFIQKPSKIWSHRFKQTFRDTRIAFPTANSNVLGIKLLTVKVGAFKTPIAVLLNCQSNRIKSQKRIEEYS